MSKIYKATIERDGNDMILILPPDVLKQLGVEVGDEIMWTLGSDGTVVITPTLMPDRAITFDLNDMEMDK